MKGREIRENQRIVRYVKPRLIHTTGRADPEAFVLRDLGDGTWEDGLSVNWLDVFPGDTPSQLQGVAQHIRLKISSRGRFAEFTVEKLKVLLADRNVNATVVHDPLEADDEHIDDPSHAQVFGLPSPLTDRAVEVGAVLAGAATLHCPPI